MATEALLTQFAVLSVLSKEAGNELRRMITDLSEE